MRYPSPAATKPHLVFVATRVPYPAVTGHYLRTMHILRGLAEHFAVHFFAFQDKDSNRGDVLRAQQALGNLCASVYIHRVRAEHNLLVLLIDLVAATLALQPFVATKYRSRSMRRRILATLSAVEVVAVHADSLPSAQYIAHLPYPKLLTNHNVEYLRLASYASAQPSWIKRRALYVQALLTKRYERDMLERVGNCVVVSETDRSELARLAPGTRFFLVNNGADTSLPPVPPPPPCGTVALWVGGMNDNYNRGAVEFFAKEVLPTVRTLIPRFCWRVVGRDPPQMLRNLARDPASGVELAGFVESLRDEYARATIVVVPMISGGGTKLKVLEAMAMGRAVVTTPVGADGIHAHDGVDIEIASSAEEFARRVIQLLEDPRRRDQIASRARALIEERYDWRSVNRAMLQAVREVIDRRGAPECAA